MFCKIDKSQIVIIACVLSLLHVYCHYCTCIVVIMGVGIFAVDQNPFKNVQNPTADKITRVMSFWREWALLRVTYPTGNR